MYAKYKKLELWDAYKDIDFIFDVIAHDDSYGVSTIFTKSPQNINLQFFESDAPPHA